MAEKIQQIRAFCFYLGGLIFLQICRKGERVLWWPEPDLNRHS